MFEITVKDYYSLSFQERDRVHIVGIHAKGAATVGDVLTDGRSNYKIVGIPLLNNPAQDSNEVNIIINTDNPEALIGKKLAAA